jgi:hypothetical protein
VDGRHGGRRQLLRRALDIPTAVTGTCRVVAVLRYRIVIELEPGLDSVCRTKGIRTTPLPNSEMLGILARYTTRVPMMPEFGGDGQSLSMRRPCA